MDEMSPVLARVAAKCAAAHDFIDRWHDDPVDSKRPSGAACDYTNCCENMRTPVHLYVLCGQRGAE